MTTPADATDAAEVCTVLVPAQAVARKDFDADAVYQEFFSAVGTRPNETYEKLLTLLPSARPGPGGLGNSTQKPAALPAPAGGVAAPAPAAEVHPLTKEWLDAEEELDRDVPLEDGDWVDVNPQDTEVLDEEGIPVVSAISRTSSGCILDAPGAVQVDNFTIEELSEADGQGADDDAPAYVPSVLARPAQSKAPAPGGRVMTGASVAGVSSVAGSAVPDRAVGQHTAEAAAGAGAVQAPKPVLTLEDEIKLRASGLRSAAGSGAGAGQAAAGVSSGALLTAADSDDEGKVEVLDGDKAAKATGGVDELLKLQGSYASRVAGGARRSTDRPAATVTTSGCVDGDEDEEQAESEAVEEEQGQSGLAQGSHGAPSEEGVVATLPGEPLATDSGADTQLISINTQDMLERMGLGDPQANGDDGDDGVDMELDLTQGRGYSEAANGSTSAVPQPLPTEPAPAGPGSSEGMQVDEDEAVTFVEVEGFRLDPDFDYDNVKLTPRAFPYNLRRPGGGPPPQHKA